tara:strand:+ start:282 stop:1466 length:1185 start_codon:yes stop_codon:yes gene_type:complete
MIGFPNKTLQQLTMERKYPMLKQDQVNPQMQQQMQMQAQAQPRTGMAGLFDKFNQRSSGSGLSGFENLAASLDPLILPSLRGGDAIRERGAQRLKSGAKNKTVEYFRSVNRNDLADAVASGSLTYTDAMKLLLQEKGQDKLFERKKELEIFKAGLVGNANVQSATDLPDLSGVMIKYKDGRVEVRTADNRTLSGEEAIKFVRTATETNFENQKAIAGAKAEGKGEAEVKLAGDKKFAESRGIARGKMVDQAKDTSNIVTSNISKYKRVLDQLNKGGKTGVLVNFLPDVTAASAAINQIRNELALNVIGSVTFGALSKGELDLAKSTAMPSATLSPEELTIWLNEAIEEQTKVQQAVQETLMHYIMGGSEQEYYEKLGVTGTSTPKEDNDPLGLN